jgi:glycosyltransferase involved in cell wall biosynthesis
MKILIVTQVVDSQHTDLGFFHAWLLEFAKACDVVTVLCLQKGTFDLPSNVRVYSLGKETGASRFTKVQNLFRIVMRERNQYDVVFVHMNPEYIALCGFLWRILRKRIALWYVHKQVNLQLRFALKLVHVVFTTSKESFRLASPKVQVIGHGIPEAAFVERTYNKSGSKKILMVGRLSRSKGITTGICLLESLGDTYELCIVGSTHTDADKEYAEELTTLVTEKKLEKRVRFVGGVSPEGVRKYYAESDVFLHTSTTGSTDKVVLEALAAGIPVVSSSEAFIDTPGVTYVVAGDNVQLAHSVARACTVTDTRVGVDYVRTTHSLKALISRILRTLGGGIL